jgi:hypothetical protein
VGALVLYGRLSGRWVDADGSLNAGVRRLLRAAALALGLVAAVTLARGGGPALLGVNAAGRVVEIQERSARGPGHRYDAVIAFTSDDGRQVQVTRPFRHRRSRPLSVGDVVAVAYLRGSPGGAQAQDHRAEWAGGVTLALVGLLLAAVSFAGRRPAAPAP